MPAQRRWLADARNRGRRYPAPAGPVPARPDRARDQWWPGRARAHRAGGRHGPARRWQPAAGKEQQEASWERLQLLLCNIMDHIPSMPARALAQPPASARWHPRLDLAGAWLSLACAAHCIALPTPALAR
ncbi:hypothetical protein G6F61_014192 [Rhizopus arrhizus]|nr:hypothetical protein G6F61_014192 [Rhizopus arrhizus]